jgi:type I restriction enzyme M protein
MSENNTSSIVSKVWSFCNVLRDGGVSYGDYLEQLIYLIFLKMAEEYRKPPYNRDIGIPEEYSWDRLKQQRGAELDIHYKKLLEELGKKPGMLGQIFLKAQNKVSDPAMLYKVIDMIDKESWVMMGVDTKGEIYERLLQKMQKIQKAEPVNTLPQDRSSGQWYIACNLNPRRQSETPAAVQAGFFLAAYDFLTSRHQLDREQSRFLKNKTFGGNEIVAGTRRLALMNMFLHNIGEIDGEPMISNSEALIADPGYRYDYILTNPPFGKKSSMTFTNEEGEQEKEDLTYNRQDFWTTTSNKQLNFVQHIHTILKTGGQAAVVLPDNVLFEGGAGETIRRKLLETTYLHTILRLTTGIFYANGVKANVLFFEAKSASKEPWTKEVWIYDYRTNVHHTLKKNPLKFSDLEDFIKCYNPDSRLSRKETWSEESPEGRFRKFGYDEIVARDKTNLDIFWLKDKSLADLDNLPDPDILANEIIENMEASLASFKEIMITINGETER